MFKLQLTSSQCLYAFTSHSLSMIFHVWFTNNNLGLMLTMGSPHAQSFTWSETGPWNIVTKITSNSDSSSPDHRLGETDLNTLPSQRLLHHINIKIQQYHLCHNLITFWESSSLPVTDSNLIKLCASDPSMLLII